MVEHSPSTLASEERDTIPPWTGVRDVRLCSCVYCVSTEQNKQTKRYNLDVGRLNGNTRATKIGLLLTHSDRIRAYGDSSRQHTQARARTHIHTHTSSRTRASTRTHTHTTPSRTRALACTHWVRKKERGRKGRQAEIKCHF